MRIRTLALVAGALSLAACGGSSAKGGGSSGSTGTTGGACTAANAATGQCACTADTDCPTGYTCDTEQTKTCIFQCTSASDCTADFAPPDTKTTCSASALGCTCDFDPSSGLAVCSTKGCGTDSDCPSGLVCESGQCTASKAGNATSCTVFPEYQVLDHGQAFTFSVQAYNGTQPVHVTDADVTWAVAGGAPLTNSGATFTANSSVSSVTEVAGVQATVNGHACTATVKVYPAPVAQRVTVIDALSGMPIQGAKVLIDSNAPSTTDQDGTVPVDLGSGGSHTVSVFNTGYDYVTLVDTGASDILIPITRNSDTNEGGVTGTIPDLFQSNSKIHAGFVGMSIAGSITDLSTSLLIGPEEPLCDNPDPTQCQVGGKSLPSDIKVPSGVLLGLGSQAFKQHFTALGAAGYCANNADGTANGTCGTRGIWGLAGDIDFDKISPLIDQISGSGGVSNINIGGVLTSLLPVLRDFNSLAVRDVAITLAPPDASGNPVASSLAPETLNVGATDGTSVRLGLKMVVHVPALPKDPDDPSKWVDGAIVLGATDVPGRGLFPLGLTAGVDNTGSITQPQNVDGHVSYTDSAGASHLDEVELNMAPNHAGTESGTYRMAVVASSFSNISNGLVGTGIVVNPGGCSAGNTNGVCYGANITYSQDFMGFPSTSSYDYASRILTVGTAPQGAGLMRLDFHDAAGHRWFVYFSPSETIVTVPTPPSGFEDRTRADDTATGARSTLLELAFDLGSSVAEDDAAQFGSAKASLEKLDKYIQRFAIKDYPAPSIQITAPTAGQTVTASSGSVAVTIAADTANSSKWVLCANTSTAAITASDLASCAAGGPVTNGQASASLPASTPTGSNVVLHAVLVDSTGSNLLNPSVEDHVQVTVQ